MLRRLCLQAVILAAGAVVMTRVVALTVRWLFRLAVLTACLVVVCILIANHL